MDWFKIKTKHILFSELSLQEIGAIVTIQAITAEKEALPSEKQIRSHVHQNTLKSLKYKLSTSGVNLEYIASKVLEDVEKVVDKRVDNKLRKQKQRAINKNVTRDVTGTSSLREDKIREDNNNNNITDDSYNKLAQHPQENFINKVMKSWTTNFPQDFKDSAGQRQKGFVFKRRQDLEKYSSAAEIIDFISTYYNYDCSEAGELTKKEEKRIVKFR